MKKYLVGLAALPLAACQSGVTFDLQSTMDAQTRGVALFDWSNTGVAGMLDQTCAFDFRQGVVLGDVVDLPGTDDRVVDGDGSQAIVTSAGIAYTVSEWGDTFPIGGATVVVDAAFARSGIVTVGLREGTCGADFTGLGTFTSLADMDCSRLRIDSGFGTDAAFVADGTTVARVDAAGVTPIEAYADLLSWDDRTGTLVIALAGGEHVRGLDAEGNTEWTIEVDGTVESIDTLGRDGMTVVTFERADGLGEVVVVSNQDGSVHADHVTPSVTGVTVSPNGDSVALVTEDNVHFYDVTPEGVGFAVPSVALEQDVAFGD